MTREEFYEKMADENLQHIAVSEIGAWPEPDTFGCMKNDRGWLVCMANEQGYIQHLFSIEKTEGAALDALMEVIRRYDKKQKS